jgi:hypothetical protein
MASSLITGIGLSLLLLFTIPKILNFYDITIDMYGPYLGFIIFILITMFVLPRTVTTDLDPSS